MADIMNDETVIKGVKKSWFLNAKFMNKEDLHGRTEGVEEWSPVGVDEYDNIIQTHWDGSSNITLLFGCRTLDFAICHMELNDGKLVVDPNNAHFCMKLSEGDEGWQVYCCDEELLDYNGNITEELSQFDHVEDNYVYRVPYTDLDAASYRNGEIVLTKEAEEKWKKILSGELPQPHFGRAAEKAEQLKKIQEESKQNILTEKIPAECFLNGKVPENYDAYDNYSAIYSDDNGNYLRTRSYASSSNLPRILVIGNKKLDFAICELSLENENLSVYSDLEITKDVKTGTLYENNLDGELMASKAKKVKALSDFSFMESSMDGSKLSYIFRVPYSDLDMNAFANGNIVLKKEAEEKYKKLLADK